MYKMYTIFEKRKDGRHYMEKTIGRGLNNQSVIIFYEENDAKKYLKYLGHGYKDYEVGTILIETEKNRNARSGKSLLRRDRCFQL